MKRRKDAFAVVTESQLGDRTADRNELIEPNKANYSHWNNLPLATPICAYGHGNFVH